jgi:hypothetical protein
MAPRICHFGQAADHESEPDQPRRPRRVSRAHALIILAALFWVGGIAFGIAAVERYEFTPGKSGLTPELWPTNSSIRPESGRATLIMLVHPQCSCTRASLDELQVIMSRMRGSVTGWVLFATPSQTGDRAEVGASWSKAERIPGVRLLRDPQAREATRFGALTSGHTVVYDRTGRLIFSGGITGARGHEGDNPGRELLLAAIESDAKRSSTYRVYGCPL